MKKRKLNSKNPKYMDASQTKEQKVIKRILINTTSHGCKIWGVWYEN
jgi:heptaprenylglyceryl phosphate synthase